MFSQSMTLQTNTIVHEATETPGQSLVARLTWFLHIQLHIKGPKIRALTQSCSSSHWEEGDIPLMSGPWV